MTQAATRLREYETIFVLAPNADNTEAERLNAKVSEVISSFGGKLVKLDNWGRRKLAYPIKRNSRGIFVYTKYVAQPGVVAEIERNFRIADSVLRYQSNLVSSIVAEDLAVDPEDIKFEPVTVAEPEEELSYEQRLGLVPSANRRPQQDDDMDSMDDDDDSDMDNDSGSEGGAR